MERGSDGERERLVNKEEGRERKIIVGQRTERSLKGEYESMERELTISSDLVPA